MDDILTHLIKTEGMQVAINFQSNVTNWYHLDDDDRFAPHEIITYLFSWRTSPQGHDYWEDIYQRHYRDYAHLRVKASKELILKPIGILNKPKKVTR